jgi:hypothetical protein
MREQVEVLEDHADIAADLVDLLEIVGELGAVDDDLALLVLLQPVDAADHRRLARPRRAADDQLLAARDLEVDVAQDVELAIPLVDADHLDRGGGIERRRFQRRRARAGRFCHSHVLVSPQRFWPAASRFSTAIE